MKNRLKLVILLIILIPIVSLSETNIISLSNFDVNEISKNTSRININISIKKGWHINSNKPYQDYLIPTKVIFDRCKMLSKTKVTYPKPDIIFLAVLGEKLSLFSGDVPIKVFGNIDSQYLDQGCSLKIQYQACNNFTCLPPNSINLNLNKKFGSFTSVKNAPKESNKSDKIFNLFITGNYLLAFILIFLAGLALNLTPCIYPIIPITVAFFGGQTKRKIKKTFMLALTYVLGLTLIYSSLGFVAASTGNLFGAALQNRFVVILIALILVILSLSMFGVYELKIPYFLMPKQSSKTGYIGAFLTGTTAGLIAAPCIGPFILGLLAYVGKLQSKLLGFSIFFTLSLGLGFPFIFLALFSNSINYLPKSGSWMVWVRKLFGVILIGMTIYILKPFWGTFLFVVILLILLISFGIYLGLIDKTANDLKKFIIVKRTFGILIIISAIIFASNLFLKKDKIVWEKFTPGILETVNNSPVIIDFYAAWCIPCKELDLVTFRDDKVVKELRRFQKIKVDMTFKDEKKEKFSNKFGVKGFPTILFIDSKGNVTTDKSVFGFVNADKMIQILKSIN